MIDITLDTTELLRFLLALLFLALALLLSRLKDLGLEHDILYSATRAIVQLGILGFIVFFIFSLEGGFIIILLAGMTMAAAHIASRRTVEALRSRSFQVSLAAIGLSSFLVIGFSLLVGIMDRSATFVIPLGGMVIGNSMLRCSIAYERLVAEMKGNRDAIENYLALGASAEEASLVFIRNSRRAAMLPSLDNLKATGVVWIPGLMAGMILAGADPLWAAEMQMVILFMILATAMLTVIIATELIRDSFFNEREQLVV